MKQGVQEEKNPTGGSAFFIHELYVGQIPYMKSTFENCASQCENTWCDSIT